jgi:catechol 2,3-dioxygenase-like lactoylglutathione lyase family enzyme
VTRPALLALSVADAPERWEALGFAVSDGRIELGGVSLHLGAPGRGIAGWTLCGVAPTGDIDGLATTVAENEATPPVNHPNGASAIDHVVVITPDFERTQRALEAAGLPLRRIRDAGGFRQGFRRLGAAILELVEAREAPPGPARFWGLVVTVDDLGAVAEHTGAVKPAVQPGRHIATLRRDCGLSLSVAFMDPEPQ